MISKLRKRELARKRSRVSSIMSAEFGSALEGLKRFKVRKGAHNIETEDTPRGAGPRILVLMGRMERFPT